MGRYLLAVAVCAGIGAGLAYRVYRRFEVAWDDVASS